jgi:predicted dehydrogenase
MREKIGWGIMATGTIANKFCEGLKNLRDTEIVAVASRSLDRALDFGRKHGIKRAYGCYEELVMDSQRWI